MIDNKNAKQIVNEPSSFSVSTISKTSKLTPKQNLKEDDRQTFIDDDFNDSDSLRYYDPTNL
jgi:hypothetical protein